MFLIICSADPLENHLKYKYHLLLVVLSDAKIGLTHGKDLALVELGEETDKKKARSPCHKIHSGPSLAHPN